MEILPAAGHPLLILVQFALTLAAGIAFPWQPRWGPDHPLVRLAIVYTIGCAVISALLSVTGFLALGPLSTGLTVLLALLPAAVRPQRFLAGLRELRPGTRGEAPAPWLVIGGITVVALLGLGGVLTPEVRSDPLYYHLIIPQLWLNFGRIVDVPENGHSYFPYGFEMVYTWALSWGSDSAAKAFHWGAGLAAAGWCARIARQATAPPAITAAIFYFLPTITYLSTTTYIDLATAMYALGCISLLIARDEEQTTAGVVLAAFLLGSACATKYTAWPLLGLPLALAGAMALWRRPGVLVAAAVAGAVPVLPWVIRNIVYTGNPVAPLMIRVFGPESAVETGLAGAFDSFAGTAHGPAALLMAPFGYAWHLIGQKYVLSLLGLLAVPLLLALPRPADAGVQRLRIRLMGMLAALFLLEALLTRGHPDGRYGLASMGIGAVLWSAFCGDLTRLRVGALPRLLNPALALALFALTLLDYRRHQADLGEGWLPILSPDERLAYRIREGGLHRDFAKVEAHLVSARAGRVTGLSYPSRTKYWAYIMGLKNDPVTAAGGPEATPEAIAAAMGRLGFTHFVDEVNPGFSVIAWQNFLDSECRKTTAGSGGAEFVIHSLGSTGDSGTAHGPTGF